jgi:hypothetical protein
VTFNRDVSQSSLAAGDLRFVLVGPQDPPEFVATAVSYDAATHTATFTLAPAGQQVLPNGNYRATLLAGSVTDAFGNALASAFTFNFSVLAGDIDGNRAVNGTDFAILAGNFGRTGMTYAQGDLNGDGSVNGSDFALLAGNFGRTVAAPAAAAPSALADPALRPAGRPLTPAKRRRVRRPPR